MDFTREPILETIITPREGYKLVIRSSKNTGQEEYLVDSVEIVAFGHALFFRSLERPKAFIMPVSDYEVVEVREARMVLKNAGLDRSIKIGGGREGNLKPNREIEKEDVSLDENEMESESVGQSAETSSAEPRPEVRVDKKRDRRRHYRKRRGREEKEEVKEDAAEPITVSLEEDKIQLSSPQEISLEVPAPVTPNLLSSLLQPPPTLISETINRYRQNDLFKGAFYLTEEEQYKPHDKVQELLNEEDEDVVPNLQEPTFASEELSQSDVEATQENIESSQEDLELIEDVIEFPLQEENMEMSTEESTESVSQETFPAFSEEQQETSNEIQEENMQEKEDFVPIDEKKEEQIPEAALPLFAEEDANEDAPQSVENVEDETHTKENIRHHHEEETP